MTKDTVLSRELRSLQEELSASHRERPSPPAKLASASGGTAASAGQPEETPEEQELRAELREFVSEIKEYVEDAENNLSAHPAASVMGAMVAGILIGYLLGRR